jgi:pimeloyl-ACP methyl ester carboxylesterase
MSFAGKRRQRTRQGLKPLARAIGLAAMVALGAAASAAPAIAQHHAISPAPIAYRTVKIDGLDIFYREAGPANAPVILLLHGFPSSSHMFRDLIPLLADRFRVIAPDYPGFGYSSQPDRANFAYTFDNLHAVVDKFTRAVGAERFALYVQDYGAPVGLRFVIRQPERVTALIVQNGNAYDEGFSPLWQDIKAYWAEDAPARRDKLRGFLAEPTTIFQYSEGVPAERRNPDAWRHDQATLERPGNAEIQLDLFRDYRTNVAAYPAIHASFKQHAFPTLIAWGKNDPIFTQAGAEAFKRDLPRAELHLLDAGHFALETHAGEIASLIREFLPRALSAKQH